MPKKFVPMMLYPSCSSRMVSPPPWLWMEVRNELLDNSDPSIDRLVDLSSKLNHTLPRRLRVLQVGTYVLVSVPRDYGMIALKEGHTYDHSKPMISTHR